MPEWEGTLGRSFWERFPHGLDYASQATPIRMPRSNEAHAFFPYHLPYGHLELKHCAQGVRNEGPLGMSGNVLTKSVDKHIYGSLTVVMRRLARDVQQAYHGIFEVLGLDGLLSFLMLHDMGGIAFLAGLDHCLDILMGGPLRVL